MQFDLQPTLRGELLTLRPLRREDFAELYAVASDPLLWEQHPQHDRWQRPVFERFFEEALASGGALLATENADGRIIGSSRYYGYVEAGSEVEIGWSFLARSHWGGRYNREMKRLMLDHAFRFVEQVVFRIGPENLRSRRAVEKLGATLSERRANEDGRQSVAYLITRETWVEGPA
jgi:N-acetyltransferase